MQDRTLVKNASSKKQVKHAEKKERYGRDVEVSDLIAVLNTAEGRRLLWRVMELCGTFGSIWESSARIHYRSGQQDIGHFIMSEIAEAGEEFLAKLMAENYNKKEKN